jgi:hypothetical protein
MAKKGRLGGMFGRRPAETTEKDNDMPAGFGNRTREQIEAALEVAREARAAKAELLRSVKEGRVTLGEILGNDYKDNERAQKLPVHTLVRALPGVGIRTADTALDELGITKGRRVGGLGTRQRERLAARFDGK